MVINHLLNAMILQVGSLGGISKPPTSNEGKLYWLARKVVGNEGMNPFTGWYIGDETSPKFPAVVEGFFN